MIASVRGMDGARCSSSIPRVNEPPMRFQSSIKNVALDASPRRVRSCRADGGRS